MTKVSDDSGVFIRELLMSSSTPAFLKAGVKDAMSLPALREQLLQSQIAVVRDDSQPETVRLASVRKIVDLFRGDA